MTTPDLAELKRLAELASPGPWKGDRIDGTVKYNLLGSDGGIVVAGDNHNSGSGPYGIMNDHDERYLIAANPAAILSLLSLLESQERQIAELKAVETIGNRSSAEVIERCAKVADPDGSVCDCERCGERRYVAAKIRALSPVTKESKNG